jgi:hypothetical protein
VRRRGLVWRRRSDGGVRVVGEAARLKRRGVVGGAEGRKRRQIHVRPEKVGTRFCLHFILFNSRDIILHSTYVP